MKLLLRRGVFGVFAAAVLAVAPVWGTPSQHAAAATPPDVGTLAGIDQWLVSHGIDPTTVVHQIGLLNYAGPNCPGVGWNCVNTDLPVVQLPAVSLTGLSMRRGQVSADTSDDNGDNEFECTRSNTTGGSSSPPKSCTVVQVRTSGKNNAHCQEQFQNGGAPVTLKCSIAQSNKKGKNSAQVSQSLDQEGNPTQTAQEQTDVNQKNDSGSNNVTATQGLTQQTDGSDSSGNQNQQADVAACVNQDANAGNDSATVGQSVQQTETSSGRSQHNQNVMPGSLNCSATPTAHPPCVDNSANPRTANLFVIINQDCNTASTATGTKNTNEQQSISQNIRTDSDPPTQTQGVDQNTCSSSAFPCGGLDQEIEQRGTGVSTDVGDQNENQSETGPSGTVQSQFGPASGGHPQTGDGSDTDATQTSNQSASTGTSSVQTETISDDCLSASPGSDCTVDQTVTENGTTTTNHCARSNCDGQRIDCAPPSTSPSGGAPVTPSASPKSSTNSTCFTTPGGPGT